MLQLPTVGSAPCLEAPSGVVGAAEPVQNVFEPGSPQGQRWVCGGGDAGTAFHLFFVSLPAGKNLYTNEYVAIKLVSSCQTGEFLHGRGGGCSSHWEGGFSPFSMVLGWDVMMWWLGGCEGAPFPLGIEGSLGTPSLQEG